MRLLHFSDPHIQLRDWRQRSLASLGPLRALERVELFRARGARYDAAEEKLRALAQMGLAHDHAVCTGDLVQLGMREEMELARAALEPLASQRERFTALAGNHDRVPLRGRAVFDFETIFPEQAQSDLPEFAPVRVRLLGPRGGAALLVVDSAVSHSWPILSRGHIEPRAVEQLSLALAHPEVQARCALVLTHHCPVRKNGRMDRPIHYLRNATNFLRAAKEGSAQAILAGHVHVRFELAETAERPRILCAGSSTDVRNPGAFSLEIEQGRIAQVRVVAL